MSPHDERVQEWAYFYERKGYKSIINVADKVRIPDLLMISPKGKLLWIEVQDRLTKNQRQRFKMLKIEIAVLPCELHVHTLWGHNGKRTKPPSKYKR